MRSLKAWFGVILAVSLILWFSAKAFASLVIFQPLPRLFQEIKGDRHMSVRTIACPLFTDYAAWRRIQSSA